MLCCCVVGFMALEKTVWPCLLQILGRTYKNENWHAAKLVENRVTALPVSINPFWKGGTPGCSQQLLPRRSSCLLMRYGDSPSCSSSLPIWLVYSPLGFLGRALALPGLVRHRDLPQAPGKPRVPSVLPATQ